MSKLSYEDFIKIYDRLKANYNGEQHNEMMLKPIYGLVKQLTPKQFFGLCLYLAENHAFLPKAVDFKKALLALTNNSAEDTWSALLKASISINAYRYDQSRYNREKDAITANLPAVAKAFLQDRNIGLAELANFSEETRLPLIKKEFLKYAQQKQVQENTLAKSLTPSDKKFFRSLTSSDHNN